MPSGVQTCALPIWVFLQGTEQGDQQLGIGVVFGGEVADIFDLLRQLRVVQKGAQSAQVWRFDADGGAWCARGELALALLVPLAAFFLPVAFAFSAVVFELRRGAWVSYSLRLGSTS